MKQDHDFAALSRLLAAQKMDVLPSGQIDRFLIEFHRRQRVALLAPPLPFWQRLSVRLSAWGEKISWGPSLSYGATVAAVAFLAFAGLDQQFSLKPAASGGLHLSLQLPGNQTTFAMIPSAVSLPGGLQASDSSSFGVRSDVGESTRYVLSSSNPAYDATAAF